MFIYDGYLSKHQNNLLLIRILFEINIVNFYCLSINS